MILQIIFIFILIIPIDFRELKKVNAKYKAVFIYSTIMTVSFVLSILIAVDKAPVSPAVIIEGLIDFILGR